ncbi:MAG: hypothetical protein JNK98_07205 [Chitinophagaceae bacterium]|nr:hypothetical protein [Chitinophagaceae bacterium]
MRTKLLQASLLLFAGIIIFTSCVSQRKSGCDTSGKIKREIKFKGFL